MYYSIARLLRQMRRRRRLGVMFILSVLALSVLGNTICFYYFERVALPSVTVGDAFWYSAVSITTIGYGDLQATTLGARAATVIFIILTGLTAFTTAVGTLVEWVVDIREKEKLGMGTPTARGHLLVVNFPGEERVRQIIEEFSSDEQHKGREVVVVTDQLERLPFGMPNVSFVRGSPLERDTYTRASIKHASQAIILSTGYSDPRSDSFVASVAFVIESLNPNTKIVAECLNPRHAILFSSSEHVSLVYTISVANNLLVQEAQDPGVTTLAQAITSNEIEGTFASTLVDLQPVNTTNYDEVAKCLLDHNVNLVGIIRDGKPMLSFTGETCRLDDLLIYIDSQRRSWKELSAMFS